LEDKFLTYNKINGPIRRHFGKQMNKETKLRIHNFTPQTALKFGSEAWVLKKREEQRLEAAQMKFFRHLFGITKLDKERNQCIKGKNGAQNKVKEINSARKSGYNTYSGWTQMEYQNKNYNINQKHEGTYDDRGRDGGTNFILRIKEQETRLTLQEHEDDDETFHTISIQFIFSKLTFKQVKKMATGIHAET